MEERIVQKPPKKGTIPLSKIKKAFQRNNYYLIKDMVIGWNLMSNGKIVKSYCKKAVLVKWARRYVKKKKGVLYIHRKNATVQNKINY